MQKKPWQSTGTPSGSIPLVGKSFTKGEMHYTAEAVTAKEQTPMAYPPMGYAQKKTVQAAEKVVKSCSSRRPGHRPFPTTANSEKLRC